MALSFAQVFDAQATNGRIRENLYDVTFDDAYVTGGEPVRAQDVGLSILYGLSVIGVSSVAGTAKTSEYNFVFDFKNSKFQAFGVGGFTPAGTATFTGTALAAHRHVLHFQTSAAANAVTAAANALRTPAAAFDVAGVANSSGEGGVVDASAGTPAGTIEFSGTAVAAAALAEAASLANLSTYVVRVKALGV
jgi:hypothetical protein